MEAYLVDFQSKVVVAGRGERWSTWATWYLKALALSVGVQDFNALVPCFEVNPANLPCWKPAVSSEAPGTTKALTHKSPEDPEAFWSCDSIGV
ncbi:MAG: hypothetical protein QXJ45_06140 [Thermoproteota archaeon]